MLTWLGILARTIRSALRSQRELAIENLALRQQVAVFKRRHPRPRLTFADRWFWILLSRAWSGWRASLVSSSPIPSSAGIVRDFVITGAGTADGADARESTPKFGNLFDACAGPIRCGVHLGFTESC